MQTVLHNVPKHLITLIETFRAHLRDKNFLDRHRVRPEDFTRERQLTFPVLMLFILQQTIKSIQRHLADFLEELAAGELFEPGTTGAVSHARAKLKASAFIELNRACLLPAIYGPDHPIRLWRGHRLFGIDGSLLRLPGTEELGQKFGWQESSNQHGPTGTRYPEARLSVVYDVLNRVGLDTGLEPSTVGEVAMAREQLLHLKPGDIALSDRGYTGYVYLALIAQGQKHFIARCSTGSFLMAQEMFGLDLANQSKVVWLHAAPDNKAECQRLGLPLKMKVRFVSLRLPTGELEVLVTSLLEENLYPTEEFLTVYHWRWGHETFHLMLKGRLELENFSGRTVEAVQQDVHAAVLLANLESILSEPAQEILDQQTTVGTQARKVNHSNSYHALKHQVLDLLYLDIPIPKVINQLMKLFNGSPVPVRPNRKVPPRRKPSFARSYNFQRRAKKAVF